MGDAEYPEWYDGQSAKVDFGKQRRFTLKVRNTLQGESGVWAVVPLEENFSWDEKCGMKGGKEVLKVEQRSKVTRPGEWVCSGKEGERR